MITCLVLWLFMFTWFVLWLYMFTCLVLWLYIFTWFVLWLFSCLVLCLYMFTRFVLCMFTCLVLWLICWPGLFSDCTCLTCLVYWPLSADVWVLPCPKRGKVERQNGPDCRSVGHDKRETKTFVLVSQMIHASYNITTNERVNHKRYDYLKDGKGRFHNPFNKGVRHNLMEFFHLRKPPREEELELLGVDVVWWLLHWVLPPSWSFQRGRGGAVGVDVVWWLCGECWLLPDAVRENEVEFPHCVASTASWLTLVSFFQSMHFVIWRLCVVYLWQCCCMVMDWTNAIFSTGYWVCLTVHLCETLWRMWICLVTSVSQTVWSWY